MYNKIKSLKYRDATNFCDRRQTHIKGEGVLWELQQLDGGCHGNILNIAR